MKIKHKLLLTFGLLIIFTMAIVGINYMTYQAMESDANFVNNAGKLRASSYKRAQLANIVVSTNDQESKQILEESMNLFDEITNDLTEGNTEKGLSVVTHEETKNFLTQIVEKWDDTYKNAYGRILSSQDKEALTVINSEVAGYVNFINDMVTGYSEYSSSKVTAAKVTNSILMMVALAVGLISFALLNKGIRGPINGLIKDLKAAF